ncbi:MAG TPA: N-acetyltransferase [Terracidiphilus sp.]
MQFRHYHPDDFAQIYAIEEVCFEPPLRFSRRYLRELLSRPRSVAWVAEEHGRIAAFAVVDLTPGPEEIVGYIETIEVLPVHRRKGIAAELLQLIQNSARAAQASLIWLHVDSRNQSAIRVYSAHGYQRHGARPNYYGRGRSAEVYVKFLHSTAV